MVAVTWLRVATLHRHLQAQRVRLTPPIGVPSKDKRDWPLLFFNNDRRSEGWALCHNGHFVSQTVRRVQ